MDCIVITHSVYFPIWASSGDLSLVMYAQKPPLNAHTYVSSKARGLIVGLSSHLHPYFVYTSNEGSC